MVQMTQNYKPDHPSSAESPNQAAFPENTENSRPETKVEASIPEKDMQQAKGYLSNLSITSYLMLISFIAVSVASVLYRQSLSETALLYIGIPLCITFLVALLPRSSSVTGRSLTALTFLFLLSIPILKEGFVCILMAAPIMYAVVGAVAGLIDYFIFRSRKSNKSTKLKSAFVVTLFGMLSLEGTHEVLTFDRENLISRSAIVEGNLEAVRQRLAEVPSFDKPRPFLVRLFPMPVTIEGDGIAVGDQRRMSFVYNKWIYSNSHKGEMIAEIQEASDTRIRSRILSDTSYLSNYLTWQSTEVVLKPIDNTHTEVTWELSYTRKLDPAWYFDPLQKYVVGKVVDIFIENIAKPKKLEKKL